MSCPNCSSSGNSYNVTAIFNPNCSNCNSDCDSDCGNANCVKYTGATLPCTTITSGDTLEVAFQKIDARVCESAGNYLVYNYNCLASPGTINNEFEFVNLITSTVCTVQSDLSTFINSTFVSYQSTVNARFLAIESPNKTCLSVGITSGDSLSTILDKQCVKFAQIDDDLDVSTVDWSNCYTVVTPPTTVVEGFVTVLDQICQLKAQVDSQGVTLPTFNNVGSCLASPTSSDSLVDTVNKMKTRLCQSPTFDINALTWGCVTKPSVVATDLQSAMQTILAQVNDYVSNKLTFSGDFIVTQTNPSDSCSGKTVALSVSSSADRYVAASVSDLTPGTLQDKLLAGTGVTLDYSATPGKVTISASGTSDDKTVKASTTDNTPDFLDNKIEGLPGTVVYISTVYNPTSKKIDIEGSLNMTNLVNQFIDLINSDSVLKQRFCSLVSSCPSPCTAPSNVQAIFVGDGTTTTTTTTTSSTSSTSTSSTTTAAPVLDTIYFGIAPTGSHPDALYIQANGTITNQNSANNVNINWTTFNASPEYCWVAIPDRVPTSYKNIWYVDVLNNGAMGSPSDLFGAPVQLTILGDTYNVWITNYQTQFVGTCQLRYS